MSQRGNAFVNTEARLELDPNPSVWSSFFNRRNQLPSWLAEPLKAMQDHLNLNGEGPIVATGHQASVWHPGILAKDLAAMAMVEYGARPVHFVADHDAHDPGLLAYPAGTEEQLHRRTWRALSYEQGIATGARPAEQPRSLPEEAPPGLSQVHQALSQHSTAENMAVQVASAVADLAKPLTGEIPRRLVTSLLQMPVGTLLLNRFALDPVAAAEAYNSAITLVPRVARPLFIDGERTELPLWRDEPEGRVRVRANELDAKGLLRPRALLASVLMRLSGCDVFIHGTGGARYDIATEAWITRWLSPEAANALAPRVTASATLHLPLEILGEAAPPELLNRMRNDPLAYEGTAPSPEKAQFLASIDAAPPRSSARRTHFAALRKWVHAQQASNSVRLETIEREISDGRQLAKSIEVAQARDWPFPLYSDAALEGLAQQIQSAFPKGMRR